MARHITFEIGGSQYQVTPVKVDRRKLYGWSEVMALDEQGRECDLVTTNETGTIIIPGRGTGLGVMSPDGLWVDRATLVAVDEEGIPAKKVPSSYSVPVKLDKKVEPREFLDYSITSFYELGQAEELLEEVGNDIYIFAYSYLDSYEPGPAFIMRGGDGETLFMLTGYWNRFEMLGLEQPRWIDESADEESDGDDIDFNMFF